MTKVFVDTAAWIALINVDDALHEQASAVKTRLQQQQCLLVTTDFVFLEVADALTWPKIRPSTINFIIYSIVKSTLKSRKKSQVYRRLLLLG